MSDRRETPVWMLKAPIELKEKLDYVRRERIKRNKDNEMVSYNRLALALSRHNKAILDLINADLKKQ